MKPVAIAAFAAGLMAAIPSVSADPPKNPKEIPENIREVGDIQRDLFSGNEGAHGGKGIRIDVGGEKKLFLLDFYDRGIHDTVSIEQQSGARYERYLSELGRKFKPLNDANSPFPVQELSSKLAEIAKKSAPLAEALLVSLKRINWNLSPREVKRTSDVHRIQSDIGTDEYVQIANRIGNSVAISKPHWNEMRQSGSSGAANQAGLLVHEAFYFMVSPKQYTDAYLEYVFPGQDFWTQSGDVARKLTYAVFQSGFQDEEPISLSDLFGKNAPLRLGNWSHPTADGNVYCQPAISSVARLELDHDMSDAQVGAWVEANWQFIRGDQVSVEFLILRFEGSTYTLPYMAQDFRNVEFLKWSFDHSRSSVNQLFPPIRIGSDLEQAKRQVVELVRQVRAFGQR